MSALLPRFVWCPVEQWEPVTAPLTNGSDNRTPQRYEAVIAQFEIEKNPRYAPVPPKTLDGKIIEAGKTWCATLVWDVTRALGCEVPHWVFGKEITANDLENWFLNAGKRQGWRDVLVDEAVKLAQQGLPTLVYFRNRNGHGHIGLVVPARPSDVGVQIAQAGTVCFTHGSIELGFGRLPVRYWTHV